jgi:hypothetical protein
MHARDSESNSLSRLFVAPSIASRTLVLFENGYAYVKSMPCDRARSVTVPPILSRLGVMTACSDMVEIDSNECYLSVACHCHVPSIGGGAHALRTSR